MITVNLSEYLRCFGQWSNEWKRYTYLVNLGKRKIVPSRNRCRSVAVTVTSIPTVSSLVRFVAFQHGYYGVTLFFRLMLKSYLHIGGQQSVEEEDSFAFFHSMRSFNSSEITSGKVGGLN